MLSTHPSGRQAAAAVIPQVLVLLGGQQDAQAVRVLLAAFGEHLISREAGEPRFLVKTIGKANTLRLVKAMANYPCFHCRNGREACGHCEGPVIGSPGADDICDRCQGLGTVHCDFCNGTSSVALNCLPEGLQPLVLLERAGRALAAFRAWLGRWDQDSSQDCGNGDGDLSHRQLVVLDACMGTFENTVLAAGSLPSRGGVYSERIEKLVQLCIAHAVHAERWMGQRLSGSSIHDGANMGLVQMGHPFLARAVEGQIEQRRHRVASASPNEGLQPPAGGAPDALTDAAA